MTEFFCKTCNAGPFDTNWQDWKRFELFHKKCPGWGLKEDTLQEIATKGLIEMDPIQGIKDQAELLREDVFENIVKVLEKEVTNEKENIIQIAVTILSAYTSDPQNLRILAPSGEGKTYLVNQVSALFPQQNIIPLSNATPQAFKYLASKKIVETKPGVWEDYDDIVGPILQHAEVFAKQNGTDVKLNAEQKKEIQGIEENTYQLLDFTNKTIIFLDNQSFALWEALKTTLSHDREYNKSFTVNKSNMGKSGTSKIVYKGWPAIIYCSAKDEISQDKTDEINTRFNTISIKGSAEKYKKMLNIKTLKANLPKSFYSKKIISDEEKNRVKLHIELVIDNMLRYTKNKPPIINFYAEAIADMFKSDAGFRSRQLANLLSNITVITLAHAKNRAKLVDESSEFPITTRSDIKIANQLTHEPHPLPLTKIQFFNDRIRPILLKHGKLTDNIFESDIKALTARDMSEHITAEFGIVIDRQKFVEIYLQPLIDHGFMESIPDPNQKTRFLYYLVPRYAREKATLESTFIDESTLDDSCVNIFKENWLSVDFTWKLIDKNGIQIEPEEKQLLTLVVSVDDVASDIRHEISGVEVSNGVDIGIVDTHQSTLEPSQKFERSTDE